MRRGNTAFALSDSRVLSDASNFILSVYLVNENRSYLHDIKRQEGGLSMNLKMKKVMAWVLVCLCVCGSMPKKMVKAASAGSIYYVPKGQQGCYTCLLYTSPSPRDRG